MVGQDPWETADGCYCCGKPRYEATHCPMKSERCHSCSKIGLRAVIYRSFSVVILRGLFLLVAISTALNLRSGSVSNLFWAASLLHSWVHRLGDPITFKSPYANGVEKYSQVVLSLDFIGLHEELYSLPRAVNNQVNNLWIVSERCLMVSVAKLTNLPIPPSLPNVVT